MTKLINCCLAGANGYVGQVLLTLIASHPNLNLSAILVKEKQPPSTHHGQRVPTYTPTEISAVIGAIDIVLLATPAEVSIEMVEMLSQHDVIVIDLSGAFRLPIDQLEHWYQLSHALADYQQGAPYGLSPFVQLPQEQTKLIANPGCYATGVLLTLMPLLQNYIIQPDSIIIDAKSGVSGAGKKAASDLMFCEMNGNFRPYKIGKHQHIPEIQKCVSDLTGQDCKMRFVSQLLPIKSGIAMSIYCQSNQSWIGDKLVAQVIKEVFAQTYKDYPFIEFAQLNQGNDPHDHFLLSLNSVVGTPNVNISFHIDNGNITLFTCLDNLWKGAASQAIENINLLYQLPVETGLLMQKGGV